MLEIKKITKAYNTGGFKQKALDEHIPIIMNDTLEVVDKILTEIKPTRILEIGTAIGFSSICFSKYLAEDGRIDTIEIESLRVEQALENIEKVGVLNTFCVDMYRTIFGFEEKEYFEAKASSNEVPNVSFE